MATCLNLLANTTIADTLTTWGSIDYSALQDFLVTSYFRPNDGGALLPWVYTIIVIIVHVPVVIVRVTRWEIVQTWCIVSTFFTVVVYIQACISTGFSADKILIWTPLILVIDASSMLQVFFLVLEANPVFVRGRVFLFDPQEGDPRASLRSRLWRWYGRHTSGLLNYKYLETPSPNRSVQEGHQLNNIVPRQDESTGGHSSQDPPPEAQLINTQDGNVFPTPAAQPVNAQSRDVFHPREGQTSNVQTPDPETQPSNAQVPDPEAQPLNANNLDASPESPLLWQDPAIYAALSSALLFIAVVILQIMGLHAAATARRHSAHDLKVSWCSPLFQPFGIAVTDGNCNVYNVEHSLSRGIGCIFIPGVWQRQWLTITIVGTTLSLILQLADLIILSLVSGTKRWRGVKMKRPWTTMVLGLVVLGITLFFGLQYASTLPPGITGRVTIAVDVNGTKAFNARLTSAGLRGTILGWNDGLFESWKESYTGTSEL